MDLLNTVSADALLSREETALNLTKSGFRTSPKTLSTIAVRGGGPPFQKFGKHVVYRWGDALAWAKGRLRPPVRSTSEPPRAA
jgi:hypothetical protein